MWNHSGLLGNYYLFKIRLSKARKLMAIYRENGKLTGWPSISVLLSTHSALANGSFMHV